MDDIYMKELAAFAAFQNHLKTNLAVDAAAHHWRPLSIAKQQGVNAVGICCSAAAMLYVVQPFHQCVFVTLCLGTCPQRDPCATKRFHRTQHSRWHSSSLMQRGQLNGFQLPVVSLWAPRSA
jgi:hypothetical protein